MQHPRVVAGLVLGNIGLGFDQFELQLCVSVLKFQSGRKTHNAASDNYDIWVAHSVVLCGMQVLCVRGVAISSTVELYESRRPGCRCWGETRKATN